MASTKSRSAKQSGTRRRTSSAGAKTRNRKTTTARKSGSGGKTTPRKTGTSRRRSRAKQPSTPEKVMQAVRSAKGPSLAAGAAARPQPVIVRQAGAAGTVALVHAACRMQLLRPRTKRSNRGPLGVAVAENAG